MNDQQDLAEVQGEPVKSDGFEMKVCSYILLKNEVFFFSFENLEYAINKHKKKVDLCQSCVKDNMQMTPVLFYALF